MIDVTRIAEIAEEVIFVFTGNRNGVACCVQREFVNIKNFVVIAGSVHLNPVS